MKKLLKDGENVIGITNGHISLQICSSEEADTVIKKQHYSHKCTRNRFLSFKINNGKGYLQLGYGIRPLCKKIYLYILRQKITVNLIVCGCLKNYPKIAKLK